MARVIRFPQAERDITDIWFYIARESGASGRMRSLTN
jgi:plasmid stabilization system protein ParE